MKKYHPTRLSEILAYVMDALILFVVYMIAVHGAPGQAFPWSLFLLYVPGIAMNCWLHIRARDSISVDSDGLTIRFAEENSSGLRGQTYTVERLSGTTETSPAGY